MAKPKQPSPKPVPINIVCDLCGEPWHLHQADKAGDVTTLECIRLLKIKAGAYRPVVIDRPVPYPVPWNPYRPPTWPYYGTITQCISQSSSTETVGVQQAYNTSPKVLMASSAGV